MPDPCRRMVDGKRKRTSLDTGNWARAMRQVAEMESRAASGRTDKPIADALEAFRGSRDVEPSTRRKYDRVKARLIEFATARHIEHVSDFDLEELDAYRAARKLNALSWSKELQHLRTFFAFCQKRKWTEENPAREMDMPKGPKPKPRLPYTNEEIAKILAACDTFGHAQYERSRARALILLMRWFGLRVSDAATFERDRIRDDQVFINAMKNVHPLWLPLSEYPDVQFALDVLPAPLGAPADCKYYFWTGLGGRDGHIKTVDRTLQAVFRKSGVKDASAHRFRHTLTTQILVNGGSIEDAANILGDSPAVIRKHYAKYSSEYQHRTLELLRRVRSSTTGTFTAHGIFGAVNHLISTVKDVLEVGVEPTCP